MNPYVRFVNALLMQNRLNASRRGDRCLTTCRQQHCCTVRWAECRDVDGHRRCRLPSMTCKPFCINLKHATGQWFDDMDLLHTVLYRSLRLKWLFLYYFPKKSKRD